jgi:ribosomal subunit interface protein
MKPKLGEGKRSRVAARKARRTALKRGIPAPRVIVTFRHVDPSDAIRDYAERRFTQIAKRLKRDCNIHLFLGIDKYRQYGEVTLKSGRLTLAAEEETKDLYSVIDLLTDKLGRQLKSHLDKTATRRVRAASTGEVMAAAEEG